MVEFFWLAWPAWWAAVSFAAARLGGKHPVLDPLLNALGIVFAVLAAWEFAKHVGT